jgi:hypothetical protein
MLATKSEGRARPLSAGYAYGEVETAIAQILKVDAEAKAGWLRGRIQHLRRLGLTPAADRGPVIYTFEWAAAWLLALRLERIGLTPAAVVKFFVANWERKPGHKFPVTSLQEVIEAARTPIKKGRKAETSYNEADVWLTVRFDDFDPDAFPTIGRVYPYRKPHPKLDNARGFFDASRTDVIDQVAIPLTELLCLLETALNGEAKT